MRDEGVAATRFGNCIDPYSPCPCPVECASAREVPRYCTGPSAREVPRYFTGSAFAPLLLKLTPAAA